MGVDFTPVHEGYFPPLYTDINLRYQQNYLQSEVLDMRRDFYLNSELVAKLLMSKRRAGDQDIFDAWGRPLVLSLKQTLTESQLKALRKQVIAYFERTVFAGESSKVIYRDSLDAGEISWFGRFLLDLGARSTDYHSQILDLRSSSDLLKQRVRKSYKSLINWGEKNLSIECVDHSSQAIDQKMEKFRELHIEVVGHETRCVETWHDQAEMISHNEAFLLLGYFNGELVTSAHFNFFNDYAYYGVSASKRELFSKPLSHAIIWVAMGELKSRGVSYLELGQQYYGELNSKVSDKEKSIAFFKRGFGGNIKVMLDIELHR